MAAQRVTRFLGRESLVVRVAALTAAAFVVVGGALHVLVADRVQAEHRQAAEFHAAFAVESVLLPGLDGVELGGPLPAATRDRLRDD